MDKLYVIAVVSNPIRFKSRYKLYKEFKERIESNPFVELYTVEQAFGDREFQITDRNNPRDIQIRSFHELWHKENMINIAAARLPIDWEYMAWIDADISFVDKNWAEETIHELQHYMVVQMFSHALDLGPKNETIQTHTGFVRSYFAENYKFPNMLKRDEYGYPRKGAYAHPGYAWAIRREAFDELGGLVDWAILGSADYHMACAFIGHVEKSIPTFTSDRYRKKLYTWQSRAENFIRRDIGYLPGTIFHFWHGKKSSRGYVSRWDIIKKYNYDPDKHLKRDSQGLWQLTDYSIGFRDAIRKYFRMRNEDGIDE